MDALRRDFPQVDFVKVYVSEAHPVDEWQVYTTNDINYCQPKSLDERLGAAARYVEENPCEGVPLVLDSMSDAAEKACAPISNKYATLVVKARGRRHRVVTGMPRTLSVSMWSSLTGRSGTRERWARSGTSQRSSAPGSITTRLHRQLRAR